MSNWKKNGRCMMRLKAKQASTLTVVKYDPSQHPSLVEEPMPPTSVQRSPPPPPPFFFFSLPPMSTCKGGRVTLSNSRARRTWRNGAMAKMMEAVILTIFFSQEGRHTGEN